MELTTCRRCGLLHAERAGAEGRARLCRAVGQRAGLVGRDARAGGRHQSAGAERGGACDRDLGAGGGEAVGGRRAIGDAAAARALQVDAVVAALEAHAGPVGAAEARIGVAEVAKSDAVVDLRDKGGRDVGVEFDAVHEQPRLVGGRSVEELDPDEASGHDGIACEDVGRRELPVHAIRAVRQLLKRDRVVVARGRAVAEGLDVGVDRVGSVDQRARRARGADRARDGRVHVGGHEPVLGVRLGRARADVGRDDPVVLAEVGGVARRYHDIVDAPRVGAVDVHRPEAALVLRGPEDSRAGAQREALGRRVRLALVDLEQVRNLR